MKTKAMGVVFLLAGCASVGGERAPRQSVAQAERAFAADAQTRTVQEAFLTAFASDAITFRPTPVNAHQALRSRPYPPATLLRWTPTVTETAAAGDLAVSTGPAEWGTRGQAPAGTGYFLSVWRALDGKWAVVFDSGIEAPIPAPVEQLSRSTATRVLRPSPARSDDIGQMQNDLLHTERQLITDYTENLRTVAASDVRLYRNGHAPSATLAQAMSLAEPDSEVEWTPQAAFVSRSGDLGYVYGSAKAASEVGYVRIYRNQDGNWRLAYDMK